MNLLEFDGHLLADDLRLIGGRGGLAMNVAEKFSPACVVVECHVILPCHTDGVVVRIVFTDGRGCNRGRCGGRSGGCGGRVGGVGGWGGSGEFEGACGADAQLAGGLIEGEVLAGDGATFVACGGRRVGLVCEEVDGLTGHISDESIGFDHELVLGQINANIFVSP